MGKLKYIIFFFLSLFFETQAQNIGETFIATNVENISVDNLGNLYFISPEGQIKKLSNKLDSVGLFNNVRQLGMIECIDVTNPLKILVFYKNFSTILVLDRFMNVKATVDLRKQNILQASAVALSFDNLIWVYDELDNKLKKIDENGAVVFESTDLRLVFNEVKPIEKIIDVDGTLYLYNSTNGLLLFDYYGAFKKKFPLLLNYTHVFIRNNQCYGIKDSIVEITDMLLLKSSQKTYPFLQNATTTYLQGEKLFYIKNRHLYVNKL